MNPKDLIGRPVFDYSKNAKDYVEIALKEKSKAEVAIELARMNPVYYRNMFGDYPLERIIDYIYWDDRESILKIEKHENVHISGPAIVKITKLNEEANA